MLDIELKNLWLEKVSVTNNQKIQREDTNRFSVNTCLYEAPQEVLEDYDVNMKAALSGKEYLWNIHSKFKNDKTFVLELINNKYENKIYPYLGGSLYNDIDIVEACLKRKEEIHSLPYGILDDKSSVLRIMKYINLFQHRGYISTKESKKELEEFTKTYKKDKDVLKLYVAYHRPDEIMNIKNKQKKLYAEFLQDEELLDKIFNNPNFINYRDVYNDLAENLRANKDIAYNMLRRNSENFKMLPQTLQEDPDFILKVVTELSFDIKECGLVIKENEEILTTYINKHKEYHTNRLKNLCTTKKMGEIALKNYLNIDCLDSSIFHEHEVLINYLLEDKENVKKFLSRVGYVPENILKICVEQDYTCLDDRQEKNNPELLKIALEKSKDIRYLPPDMYNDRELVYHLLLENNNNAITIKNKPELSIIYRNDHDIVKKMISISPDFIYMSPKYRANKEMAQYAIEKGLDDITLLDSSLYSDKEIAMSLLKKSFKSYAKLPYDLRNNHDVVLSALSSPNATIRLFQEILLHSDLYENKDFYIKMIQKLPRMYSAIFDTDKLKNDLDVLYHYVSSTELGNINLSKDTLSLYNSSSIEQAREKIILEYKTKEIEKLDKLLSTKNENKPKIKI